MTVDAAGYDAAAMAKSLQEQLALLIDHFGNDAELSRLSGVPRPQIGQYRRGERGLSVDAVERLAKALGAELIVQQVNRAKGGGAR